MADCSEQSALQSVSTTLANRAKRNCSLADASIFHPATGGVAKKEVGTDGARN
jgi:hypothetical protein